MKTGTSSQIETSHLIPSFLKNNAVADSWQSRMSLPQESFGKATPEHEPLDLVGHTLNGRPIYRAWQLALLLGISPGLLSSSLGGIPTHLRPFEVFDEDHEAYAERLTLTPEAAFKSEGKTTLGRETGVLSDLRRLAVLARTSESSGLPESNNAGWDDLMEAFREF